MNLSSVTSTETNACLCDTELASQMHCEQQQQHCEQQQQHCEQPEYCAVDHAAEEHSTACQSNWDLENGPARNSRFRWISLAAVSAAVTVAIAPLAVGAWQRSHKVNVERQVDTTSSLTNAAGTHKQQAKMESSTLTGADSESPELSPPDYVALREPTEDGERVRIVVLEPTRDIFIHESNSDGIQVRVRRYLFGTSTEQMVSAVDGQDLKDQSPEAFEIYQSHIGKAHFVGPAVSIYPSEEFLGIQPTGFLTAMPLDSAKDASEKSASATNNKNLMGKKATESKTKENKTKPEPTSSKAKAKPKPDSSSKKNKLTSQKTTGKSQETSKKQESSKNQVKPADKTTKTKKATAPNKAAKSDKSAQGKSAKKSSKETATKQPKSTKSTKSDSAKSKADPKNNSQKSMKNREPNQKNESSSKSSKPKVEATKKSAAQRFENESSEIFQLAAELNIADPKHPN